MGGRPTPLNVKKVLANQGLVRKLIVAKYGASAADDEDLYQAGLIGLCIAASAFERGQVAERFSSYARSVILREVAKCWVTSGQRLLPRRRRSERAEILRHIESLTRSLGRVPATQEIVGSWPGPRPPTPAAVERALRPEPVVLLVEETRDDVIDDADVDIEALLDAKRRFERLSPAEQEQLRGSRG